MLISIACFRVSRLDEYMEQPLLCDNWITNNLKDTFLKLEGFGVITTLINRFNYLVDIISIIKLEK